MRNCSHRLSWRADLWKAEVQPAFVFYFIFIYLLDAGLEDLDGVTKSLAPGFLYKNNKRVDKRNSSVPRRL